MKKPGTRPGNAAARPHGGDNCYRFMALAMFEEAGVELEQLS